MLPNIYHIKQNVIQNNGCIFAVQCDDDAQCLGNNGADVCVREKPGDPKGNCGM